jgi:hypothetical protein
MKRSTCRTPICSRFSSMQYIYFGRALPNLTTTICVPCIKCTTRRTSVCIHFSFLQYIRFGCSAFTTSTCHLAIRSLLALHACRTYSTWRTFRIPPLRCTCQILHITHAPCFSCGLCNMTKNILHDGCKTNRPCTTTTPYITFPCQTSSSNDFQTNMLSSSYHHLRNFPPFVIFSARILLIS